ncbi:MULTISPECIES: lytic transglycosylase domain-containing protein [unclassified Paraburkholderia]|uniref:lytic transglycosylase domain-containing protein n=1 Tax=unclassified Paraburkholderia TaxID=2615204 RepID=UPI00223AF32A|nr:MULTISPECIES: lytic transglycosylase domain-containing protein [unclassified Paraburkholderia]
MAWRTAASQSRHRFGIVSGFDRHAISAAGAKGLMQVLPTAHPQVVALNKDLSDPAENVRIGSSILRGYLDAT